MLSPIELNNCSTSAAIYFKEHGLKYRALLLAAFNWKMHRLNEFFPEVFLRLNINTTRTSS